MLLKEHRVITNSVLRSKQVSQTFLVARTCTQYRSVFIERWGGLGVGADRTEVLVAAHPSQLPLWEPWGSFLPRPDVVVIGTWMHIRKHRMLGQFTMCHEGVDTLFKRGCSLAGLVILPLYISQNRVWVEPGFFQFLARLLNCYLVAFEKL